MDCPSCRSSNVGVNHDFAQVGLGVGGVAGYAAATAGTGKGATLEFLSVVQLELG